MPLIGSPHCSMFSKSSPLDSASAFFIDRPTFKFSSKMTATEECLPSFQMLHAACSSYFLQRVCSICIWLIGIRCTISGHRKTNDPFSELGDRLPKNCEVGGIAQLRLLIDFLINQKATRSALLIPDIFSSAAFHFSTLLPLSITPKPASGDGSSCQLAFSGHILPDLESRLRELAGSDMISIKATPFEWAKPMDRFVYCRRDDQKENPPCGAAS